MKCSTTFWRELKTSSQPKTALSETKQVKPGSLGLSETFAN